MPRRVNLVILLGLIISAVFSFGLSAGAQEPDATDPTEVEIEVAQAELTELRTQAEVAAEEYNSAAFRAELLNGEIADTTRALEEAEGRLITAQEDLDGQAAQMYKSGNVAFLDVLFGANDFNDFATRLDLWLRLLVDQQNEVEELRAARDDIKTQSEERALQVENQEQTLADMQARWEWANALQADAEAYLNSLNEELRAEIEAAQEAAAAEAAAAAAEAAEEAQRNLEQQEEAQRNLEQAPVEAAPVAQTTQTPDPAAEQALAAADEQAKLAAEQREAQRQAEENAAKEAAAVEQARQALKDAQNEAERKKAQEEAAAAEKRARDEANRAAEAELAKKNAEQALADERKKAQAATPSDPILLPKDKDQPKTASDPDADPKGNGQPKGKDQPKTASDPESDPVFLPKDQDQPKTASDPDSDPKSKDLPKGEGQPKAAPKAASGGGGAPIAEARSVLGAPYVLGGEDPSGFDCSGLVKWSYRGIRDLPHSVDGIGSSGTQISVAEAGPGDVLVWPGYHVAMVTDPGMMIHASNYHMQVIEVSQGAMEPPSYAVRL
ncbi:MAG: NlpC/P60 family protein [Actinomycetota bacterium]|nr:NlpC/P60 family protein [Actinomycetota bacterium]